MKFTEVRRSVLKLLFRGNKAVGAYDLAAAFEKECGRHVTPTTVYRALDFLEQQGLVTHLPSTRTYVVRILPHGVENSMFFVCNKCGAIAQSQDPEVERAIHLAASALGFYAHARVIDVDGTCRRCSK